MQQYGHRPLVLHGAHHLFQQPRGASLQGGAGPRREAALVAICCKECFPVSRGMLQGCFLVSQSHAVCLPSRDARPCLSLAGIPKPPACRP